MSEDEVAAFYDFLRLALHQLTEWSK